MAKICWGRSKSFLYDFVFQVISEKTLCSKDFTRNIRFLYENNRNSVFEIRTFHFAGYSSGKAEDPCHQNKRPKHQLWILGVIVTYAHSMGFVYFVIRIVWSHPFLMFLVNFFSYMHPRFHQNLCHHLIIEQIPTVLEF